MPLERKYQKIFAKNADGTDLSIVGSKSQDNPQYSTDVEEIQSLSNWLTGLRAQVTSSDAPYLQDQNSIFYVITSQLAYLFQAGVAEWNSQTEYVANRSLVLRNGKVYLAIANSTNVEPEVTSGWESYWQNLLSWSKIVGAIYNQTDLWNIILSDGLVFNSTVASAIGGYPLGAILNYTDGYGNIIKIKSLVNNNTDEPSASNIKTPSNPSATKWEIVSNKMSNLYITNPSSGAAKPYGKIYLDNNGYLHIDDTVGLAFDSMGSILITNGVINFGFNSLLVNSNPIVRLPDYASGYSIGGSSASFSIDNDGWILATQSQSNSEFKINSQTIWNVSTYYNKQLLMPVKSGDTIFRNNVSVTFYPYR